MTPSVERSPHPRGARPYRFAGALDERHAPGILSRGGRSTEAAADAAWIVERLLRRAPEEMPAAWPGLDRAAQRARELAAEWKLYDYQCDGAAFIAQRDYALLHDEMGIGKTAQSLAAAEARLSFTRAAPDHPSVLVLCPALVKYNWEREVARWTGKSCAVLDGLRPTGIPRARYVVANYDILPQARRKDASGKLHPAVHLPGWGPLVAAHGFQIAILDEAHMLCGRTAQRTVATRKALARVPIVWGLTGTPQPNYVRDLWSLCDLISGGLWGPSYWRWAIEYVGAYQGEYGWIDTGTGRLEELAARIRFFSIGRTKEEVRLQLPELRYETTRVDLDLAAPVEDVTATDDFIVQRNVVQARLKKLATAVRPVIVEHVTAALAAQQKVVVFTYSREQCEKIAAGLRKKVECSVQGVHGDLDAEGRDRQAEVFRGLARPAAFVATVDSIGIGLSLVGADLVVVADLMHEPWKILQAIRRCYRIGTVDRVLVQFVVPRGSIAEDVAHHVVEKLKTIAQTTGKDNVEMVTALTDEAGDRAFMARLFAKLRREGDQ